MFSAILINLVLGVLLTVTLYWFYSYCWFLPSPFNTNCLQFFFDRENNDSEYPLHLILSFCIVSFALQLTIPFGCVVLKQLLTSQLSILDSLIICTIPVIFMLFRKLLSFWIDYSGRRKVWFTIIPGCSDEDFEYEYSLLGQKYKDFRIELLEKTESGNQEYKIHYTAEPSEGLPIKNLVAKFLPVSCGLWAICLTGGLIGSWFFRLGN